MLYVQYNCHLQYKYPILDLDGHGLYNKVIKTQIRRLICCVLFCILEYSVESYMEPLWKQQLVLCSLSTRRFLAVKPLFIQRFEGIFRCFLLSHGALTFCCLLAISVGCFALNG